MMTFSKTDKSLTVVVIENGRSTVYPVVSTHPNYAKILEALKAKDQDAVVNLISISKTIGNFTEGSLVVNDGVVSFRNRPLHGLDVTRLLEYIKDGIPFRPLARFLERKHKNPSYRSINELYKFLEHREMTLTDRGTIIGYKGVKNDYYSVMGNTATIMISGETDSGGHILNKIGAEIRCDRSCVCDDYQQGCSPGLHIGSLAYAKGWGAKVLVVEFDPEDVVSVPDDCECQKLRACAYRVIAEYDGNLVKEASTISQTDVDGIDNNDDESESNDEGHCLCGYCPDDGCDDQDDGYDETTGYSNPTGPSPSYQDGFNDGMKDGRAHKARKHHITDLDSADGKVYNYIDGYNHGYRSGRYNK